MKHEIPPVPSEALTQREIQVLHLICDGHGTKQVAAQLAISFKTAVSHRAHIMQKARVHDAVSLFRWAIEHGYVRVEQKGDAPTLALAR